VTRPLPGGGNGVLEQDIIDAIEDLSHEPDGWTQLLGLIISQREDLKASFHFYNAEAERAPTLWTVNHDRAAVSAFLDDYIQICPWPEIHAAQPVGHAYTGREVTPPDQFLGTAFYEEWARPNGYGAGVALRLHDSPVGFANITLDYGYEHPVDTDVYLKTRLEALWPLLQNRMEILRTMPVRNGARISVEQQLDQRPYAAFMIDTHGHVGYMNAHAEAAVRNERGIKVAPGNILQVQDDGTHDEFRKHLRRAAAPHIVQTQMQPTSMILPIAEENGPNILTVRPVRNGMGPVDLSLCHLGLMRKHTLMVSLWYRSDAYEIAADRIREALAYTPTESRVAEALLRYPTLGEVAKTLGVKPATARWHIKNLLEKSGCHSQPQFVQMLLDLFY